METKTEPDWWPRLAVREGDWKLAMTYDASRVELHQLINDRAEAKDVSKENPEVVKRLSKLVLDWKASLPEQAGPGVHQQGPARTRTKEPSRRGRPRRSPPSSAPRRLPDGTRTKTAC